MFWTLDVGSWRHRLLWIKPCDWSFYSLNNFHYRKNVFISLYKSMGLWHFLFGTQGGRSHSVHFSFTIKCGYMWLSSHTLDMPFSMLLFLFEVIQTQKSFFFYLRLQTTRTTMPICPTLKWTQTSGARRPERRSALPWKSSPTCWRSIMGINSSFQTGTWSPQEVSSLSHGHVRLCRMCCGLVLWLVLWCRLVCWLVFSICVVASPQTPRPLPL